MDLEGFCAEIQVEKRGFEGEDENGFWGMMPDTTIREAKTRYWNIDSVMNLLPRGNVGSNQDKN